MSGKCRASLRAKTLENVKRSLLSQADKNCIAEVFERYEKSHDLINRKNAEIERLTADRYLLKEDGQIELLPRTDLDQIRAEARSEAIKEFAERCIFETKNRQMIKGQDMFYDSGYQACLMMFRKVSKEIAKEMGVEL